MLKIVSALNGFSVRQSVTTLGIELQLQLKNIIFQKKFKKIFFFVSGKKWKKLCFGWNFLWVIFRVRQPMEDNQKIFFFQKKKLKNIFFCFLEKNHFLVKFFLWSSSVEDDLWKTTWLIISLPCTSLMLVLPKYNFYFYSSKL